MGSDEERKRGEVREPRYPLRVPLHSIPGGRPRYRGGCFRCGIQFMGDHDTVVILKDAGPHFCERCGDREIKATAPRAA